MDAGVGSCRTDCGSGLGRGALGWLFIDEAGQATPQMAAGAMWRAQHAVVVGDPLQLKAVVSLPWTAQQALRRDYGVDEEWVPGRTSVQQLADRGNRFGTTLPAELPDGSTEVWVGAPLRVHRRCDDPMFTISNVIAYDGLMVSGTPDRGPYRYGPASSWVDVVSSRAEGHWIPEEGGALRQILERLSATDGIDPAKTRLDSARCLTVWTAEEDRSDGRRGCETACETVQGP